MNQTTDFNSAAPYCPSAMALLESLITERITIETVSLSPDPITGGCFRVTTSYKGFVPASEYFVYTVNYHKPARKI